ncbi:coiled-coil domain-containing protein [Clostridium diolis]|uniref:Uncharacterized protein n=2 Tax=Clostridium TaxID=1485 RepID=A0AAV3W542_9CLOT|nr:hypothetical protein [Clostridium diolis]QES73723.1 hypothetical protein F3K33_13180 [Clostridium diolis]GEA33418.1 hypothetical protein CDIOL_43410 [Clostridium diolis]
MNSIYVDYTDNIWKFFRNDNRELCYKIMYEEGKWTKENLINNEVLGFAVYVEGDERIHIVYSNIKGELKYCTMKDKHWVGKTLYQMDFDEFQIEHLKIEIIGEEMHIFFLLISNDGSDHGVLMHCAWNGKETKFFSLQDIVLVPNLKEYYLVNTNEQSGLEVFFITDEGDEVSLNYCNFENRKWSSAKRLYGIQGDDISFEVLRDQQQDVHILNKSREDLLYFIDHVCIDISGNIQVYRVRESNMKLIDPILFIGNNQLCACWIEQNKIFYSFFNNEQWESPIYFDKGNEFTVMRYHCFMHYNRDNSVKLLETYGTDEPDLNLYIPNRFTMNNSLKHETNQVNNEISFNENEEIQNLKIELSKVKLEKKNLDRKIDSLNMQLEKKQRFMDDYEERIAIILEQKRKTDENYNVFIELQQNLQKEFDDTKKQLDDAKKQLNEAKDQLLKEKDIRISIEKKLLELENENLIIRQKVMTINEEKNKLYEDLEFERNQSIMERLLRKKPSGI